MLRRIGAIGAIGGNSAVISYRRFSSPSSSENVGFFKKTLDSMVKNRQGRYFHTSSSISLLLNTILSFVFPFLISYFHFKFSPFPFSLVLVFLFLFPHMQHIHVYIAIVNGIGMYFVLSYAVYNYKVKLAWEEFQVCCVCMCCNYFNVVLGTQSYTQRSKKWMFVYIIILSHDIILVGHCG